MDFLVRVIFLLFCVQIAAFADSPCIIELDCPECIPDNMPLIKSHRAANGSVSASTGDEVQLSCGGAGKFLLYPLRAELLAVCEGGRLRVTHDGQLRHLLELGCQENVFEDVLHSVEHCGSPLQGRAYQVQESSGSVRHLATLCFDEDRALPVRARGGGGGGELLPAHAHRSAPLSLLGNFNHMFDARVRHHAERLYSDDVSLNRRLYQLVKHERVSFAHQTLTSAKLLSPGYFNDQDMRVTDFASNKFAAWSSVAAGNLQHLQQDVATALASQPRLQVYAGTTDVTALRTRHGKHKLYLKAGHRFPVAKYIWTVLIDARENRSVALVVLNDPFVAVSEIKDAVFCESSCGRVTWLKELTHARRYESPVYGLAFCCHVKEFTERVTEMPKDLVKDIKLGNDGLLTEILI